MELSSCTAGELTFAVGYLEVDEATRVEAVKQVLRNALRVNMSLPASTTPLAGEAAQTVDGTGPDGKPLRAQSRIFSNSTSVFQVTVFGPQLKAEPVDFFFSSIKPPA